MRLSFAIACLCLAAMPALAQSKRAQPTPITIPFEHERAALRGDRALVRLNDDITTRTFPNHRVAEVPVVEGRLGEHARMADGVLLYFPFSRVVAATQELHRHDGAHVNLINRFDSALGPVCARDVDSGQPVELRKAGETISVVRHMDHGYRVTTVAETRWLKTEPAGERLFAQCNRPAEVRNAGVTTTPAAPKTTAPKATAPKPVSRPASAAKPAPTKKPAAVASSRPDAD